MSSLSIIAGASGLSAGQELTFFYPSTEWDMAQGFDCFCGSENCRGWIGGASNMRRAQLEGMWLNAHIREMLEESDISSGNNHGASAGAGANGALSGNGKGSALLPVVDVVVRSGHGNGGSTDGVRDVAEEALKLSLEQARKMLDAAQKALDIYTSLYSENRDVESNSTGTVRQNGLGSRELSGEMGGDTRRGVTSREMSGEMGGDTVIQV